MVVTGPATDTGRTTPDVRLGPLASGLADCSQDGSQVLAVDPAVAIEVQLVLLAEQAGQQEAHQVAAIHAAVTIDGVPGLTYGIQSTTDLSNTNSWVGEANITLSLPVQLWFDLDPATHPRKYYRVVPGPISIP